MYVLTLIAPAFLVTTVLVVLPHFAIAQTASLECMQLSNLPDNETAFALRLQAPTTIDPARAEAACRAALRVDPANPTLMFQLGRALTLANKQLEAIKYYLEAADRRHAGSMNDLGEVYEYGVGVPKNLPTAIVWYERAAELGHTGAMTHMGQLSENGIGIPQDLATARWWYEKAATLGNASSMNRLANLLRQEGNLPAAANWYLKAAQQGLASAMNSLGEFSEAGLGVPKDYRTARNWYQKAADLGNADAMGHLGALIESGQGGAQNLETAREWYVKGAALNGRVAMHNLGAMLENGRGTSKSLSEAKLWYERAAALKYPPALDDLGRMHLTGVGAPKSYVRAKALFEQASALGDAKSMNNLGMLYLDGRGVQKDIKMAKTWFERAATLNNPEAQENLKRLEQGDFIDGPQIAARRASCVQTCVALHRTYVNSICVRYSLMDNGDKPERTKCIDMSLTSARQCRDSCREWAPTSLADNKCVTCFQGWIACSLNQEPPNSIQEDDRTYVADSKTCRAALADCMTNCHRQAAGAP